MKRLDWEVVDRGLLTRLVDEGCTPAQVAERMGITFQMAHALVRRLQSSGLPEFVTVANVSARPVLPARQLHFASFKALHDEGLWPAEIARRLGFSAVWVRRVLTAHGVTPHRGYAQVSGPQNAERNARMATMYRQGLTLEKIGQEFGITRERVRQLIRAAGVLRQEGGQSKIARTHRQAKAAKREARSLNRYGMPESEVAKWRSNGVLAAYRSQENSAGNRGIDWGLTFAQWLDVWLTSGKLEHRGRGKGKYVMSRIKDSGGYVIGNVHIQLATENSKEAVKQWKGKKKTARGVFCHYPGTDRPFLSRVGRLQIGRFATEDEAAEARRNYIAANGLACKRDGTVNGQRKAA